MSDDHQGNGKTTAFITGMLMGMLLMIGAVGTLYVTQTRHQMMRAEEARMEAEAARMEAEMLRARAEAAARKAKE